MVQNAHGSFWASRPAVLPSTTSIWALRPNGAAAFDCLLDVVRFKTCHHEKVQGICYDPRHCGAIHAPDVPGQKYLNRRRFGCKVGSALEPTHDVNAWRFYRLYHERLAAGFKGRLLSEGGMSRRAAAAGWCRPLPASYARRLVSHPTGGFSAQHRDTEGGLPGQAAAASAGYACNHPSPPLRFGVEFVPAN